MPCVVDYTFAADRVAAAQKLREDEQCELMLVGQWLPRLGTDELLGIVSGVTGNPAILVYANKAQPSDRIDAAFATTFPALTILKILCAQITLGLLR